MTAAAPAIRTDGLVKRYDGRTVLEDVTLDVGHGELVALLGPNGAGKTTLVEILEGYRRADGGRVEVLGERDPSRAPRAWRARVGLMLQEGGVDPRLTPREAIGLFGRFHAAPRGVDELLDLVGLQAAAGTRYRRLSGGERQRLALALALVGRPELLFLDEPTAGMDPRAKADTRGLLGELRAAGTTILLTTHDLGDVERLADRVAILHRGRIVAAGPPADVGSGSPGVEVRFDRQLDEPALRSLRTALAVRWPLAAVAVDGADGSAALVQGVPAVPEAVAAVAGWAAGAGILIAELRTDAGGLEARYLELTGDLEAVR